MCDPLLGLNCGALCGDCTDECEGAEYCGVPPQWVDWPACGGRGTQFELERPVLPADGMRFSATFGSPRPFIVLPRAKLSLPAGGRGT